MPTERVLVVDDDPAILTLCQHILQADGYAVVGAKRGDEALAKLDQEKFDLLLTDIRLPGLNGLEITQHLRDRGLELTVVTMTGYSNMEMAIQAVSLGVDEFIIKPFTPDMLRIHVARALEKWRLRRENLRLRTLMPLLQPVASLRQAGTREEVYTELLTATCSLLETPDAALLTSFDDKPYEVAALQGTRLEALATAGNPYDWLPTREGAEEIRVGRGLDEARIPAGLTGSWLVTAPLARRSEVQSLVVAAAAGRPTPSELEALRLVCAHAAVSLDNLELLSELRRAYDGAHELEQLKSDFINITGHELRTPLAVVIGFANILQDRLDGELKEYAKQVVAHAERLKQISDDMLNLKLLQVGEADLQIEPCRVDEIVQNVVAAYRSLAEDRNQSVEVHIADRVGQIPADRNMLALMVGALLSNAIKFSARGTCIRVSADGDSHQIILQVQDQGKGLEQDQSAHIFDAFYRTDNSLARSEGGLGLGLTLTREMVKAHGGEIWVKSEKNRGSTFYISLPRESLVGRAADRHTST